MIWRHLVTRASEGVRGCVGVVLTYRIEMRRFRGSCSKGPVQCRAGGGLHARIPGWGGARRNATAPHPRLCGDTAPAVGSYKLSFPTAQSVRRSPVELEKTCISSGRGTTCSVEPFSGT